MLKISKLTDYAVVILSRLAVFPQKLFSASEIAEQTTITLPTVSKLLKLLTKAHLLESVCGAEGGYRLVRPSNQITLVDVVNAIEGLPSLTICCQPAKGNCMQGAACTVKGNWQYLNHFILKTLANLTLADMLRPLEQHPFFGHVMSIERGEINAV